MSEIIHRKKRLSSFKLIVLGFAGVIVLGALILMLPFSSTAGVVTPFHEALFTSTSAVCVTGLVVQDTGSYWSAFGQTVILLMIQIGGLGADAAQYHAGRHLCPEGRRDRPPDPLYCTGNFFDRAYRNDRHAADILQKLRYQGNLDGGISFNFRLLQRRL